MNANGDMSQTYILYDVTNTVIHDCRNNILNLENDQQLYLINFEYMQY